MLTSNSKIKVLITDDSLLVRAVLRELLESDSDIEVIGEATNGKEALEQVLLLKPDIVTMDLEMPVMGGHKAIEEIMAIYAVPILVISSLDDAENAYAAISHGALEVIGKPQLESLVAKQFIAKVKMLSKIKVIKHLRPKSAKPPQVPVVKRNTAQVMLTEQKQQVFAIASSTGGPRALEAILKKLPADFSSPIVIAQHISAGFEQGMADWLNHIIPMQVKIARDSELLKPGQVYISPANQHLSISANQRVVLQSATDGDIYHPSCDILLTSIAKAYAEKAVGIICTGMGSDGAQGMEAINTAGGMTIAQDEESSVVFGMNQVAISRHCIQHVLSLNAIATEMRALTSSQYKSDLSFS